ncbi:hypothetical protein [Hyphomonas sp.]|uniref:hypothetical protein n=1 Tax=Hyphomonas sp. TaxID=87 RepID=UPI0025C2332B|nr:hypothetical protein [Hyphomonas sp.]
MKPKLIKIDTDINSGTLTFVLDNGKTETLNINDPQLKSALKALGYKLVPKEAAAH